MKKIKAMTHKSLMKAEYKKDPALKKRIEAGVQRLKLIQQIVVRREELGLTQAQLAKRLGVSQPFIAKIENDDASNLSLETLIKIAHALESDVEIHFRKKKAA